MAERYVIGLVFSPLVDGLHDGGHEDLVLRHGLDADRHSVQPLPSRITRHASRNVLSECCSSATWAKR